MEVASDFFALITYHGVIYYLARGLSNIQVGLATRMVIATDCFSPHEGWDVVAFNLAYIARAMGLIAWVLLIMPGLVPAIS
jgi:hypothetical protein